MFVFSLGMGLVNLGIHSTLLMSFRTKSRLGGTFPRLSCRLVSKGLIGLASGCYFKLYELDK